MMKDSHTDEEIKDIFALKKIAVVGMSRYPIKAAHFVPKYLSEQGFDITPVNPTPIKYWEKNLTLVNHP